MCPRGEEDRRKNSVGARDNKNPPLSSEKLVGPNWEAFPASLRTASSLCVVNVIGCNITKVNYL